jgi:C4-dicarboxylate-specific signal transduction histidine kinase
LTASIAHEVNQPIAGIVTNASTCLRTLSADPPKIDIAREAARRMIRDGNRVSEVIARLRALFSKKESTAENVDLSEAAREVVVLCPEELQRNRVILRRSWSCKKLQRVSPCLAVRHIFSTLQVRQQVLGQI